MYERQETASKNKNAAKRLRSFLNVFVYDERKEVVFREYNYLIISMPKAFAISSFHSTFRVLLLRLSICLIFARTHRHTHVPFTSVLIEHIMPEQVNEPTSPCHVCIFILNLRFIIRSDPMEMHKFRIYVRQATEWTDKDKIACVPM